jgi:aminoglycoside phosphotransferase
VAEDEMQRGETAMKLPEPVADSLEGFETTWEDRKTGSEAQVFRFVRPGVQGCYLKISSSRKDASLEREAERMRWLAGKLPVPQVICYHREGAVEHLVTTELPGASSHRAEHRDDIPGLVQLLAEGLRMIHQVLTDGCPFDATVAALLAQSLPRVSDPEVLDYLREGRPESEDLVFTHGDYCLPNILVDRGRLGGFIDWGYAGVGDRYRDLSSCAWSVGHNLGEEWIPFFFAAYGVVIDQEKFDYYGSVEVS